MTMGQMVKSIEEKLVLWLSHRRLPLMLAIIVLVLAMPSLWTGLALDDYYTQMIIQGEEFFDEASKSSLSIYTWLDGNPARTRQLIDKGLVPWWTLPNARINFWRPLAVLTHVMDYALWPASPLIMHLQNLFWLGLLTVLAMLLYRRFFPILWVAGLAALLYTIDDAHAIPAGWIAHRSTLISVVFGIAVILFHDYWRKSKRIYPGLLAFFFFILALLANEAAIAICGYLFSYSLFVDNDDWKTRMTRLIPYACIVGIWILIYKSGGYGVWGAESYIDPFVSPIHFLGRLIVRAPVMLTGQWGFPPSSFYMAVQSTWKQFMLLWAVVFLVFLGAVLYRYLRNDRLARFWGMGMVLGVLPACTNMPADRHLFFIGLGAMGLLAQFFHQVRAKSDPIAPIRGPVVRSLCVILIIVHIILPPFLFPLRIIGFTAGSNAITESITNAGIDDSAADDTLVILNAPVLYSLYFSVIRNQNFQSTPAFIRSLGPNQGFLIPIQVSRPDERSLLVKPEGGFEWMFYRDHAHPLKVGSHVELSGMTAEVLSLTKEGWPSEVLYRFIVPLEDPSIVWLKIQDFSLVPFSLPAVGESVVLHR